MGVQLEQALEDIKRMLLEGKFSAARDCSARLLESNKLNAQLWVFLGESFHNLKEFDEAWAAYERAWLLDPLAAWADVVREQLKPYLTGGKTKIDHLLRVPKVSVAAAIIAKDEARTIEKCVTALIPAVDEVIVIDTGSTDGTDDIARSAGARVYYYEWDDDFSAARNFGLTKVESEWVLWVDADEVLVPDDVNSPRTAAGLFNGWDPPAILRIGQINHIAGHTEVNYDMSRFFPTRYGLRFWGRIHEQVGPSTGGLFSVSYPRPMVRIRVNHDGYDPSVMREKKKLERNIRLLRLAIEEDPGDVASMGFLGRELFLHGEIEESVRVLYDAEQKATSIPQYGRLPEVRTYLIEGLLRLNRIDEAVEVAKRAVQDDPTYPTTWYLLGKAEMAKAIQLLASATKAFQTARERGPNYRGIVSFDRSIMTWKGLAALADVLKLQGDFERAYDLYVEALRMTSDRNILEEQVRRLESQAMSISKKMKLRPSQEGGLGW